MGLYASASRQFTGFLDWFIPAELKASEESRRRVRTFLVSHVAGPPTGAVVAGHLVYVNPNFAAWGLAAGVLLFLAFPFLLRWTQRYDEVALASLLHFIFLIFFVAFFSGGIASGALPWTLTVPIVCVFFVHGWYRIIGFLTLLGGYAALISASVFGYELPNKFEGGSGAVDLILLLAAAGYITVMALAYINLYEFSIERLRWAKQAAESANRAKSEFLATMSHELRTPLNAIIGLSQMMSNQTLGPIANPRYLEYSRDIEKSGAHLLELLSDILDIAKIESGRLDMRVSACDPREVVERAQHIVKPMAAERRVSVRCVFAEDLPALLADERLLRQVAINLLTNAIKFSSDGSEVVVDVQQNVGDDALHLAVRDKGCGIPASELGRILDPFEQIEAAISRKHGGIGLGLPLSKRIVEMHGGSLTVESTFGEGTCVTVRLPLRQPGAPGTTAHDATIGTRGAADAGIVASAPRYP